MALSYAGRSGHGVEGLETRRVLLREEYGHPDIAISVDGPPKSDWLASYFRDQVHNGVSFKAGQTVQVGWALLKFADGDAGELTVSEPDFASMPVQWVAGISRVLRHLIIQREVCNQIGVEPCFPSMIQPGVVSPNFVGGRSAFTMSRDDEGWVFQSADDECEGARFCSLYAVGIERTVVIPFLALPPGAVVKWVSGSAEIEFKDRRYSSRSNSFLDRLLASPALT